MTGNDIFVTRPYSQIKNEDGVLLGGLHGINVPATGPYILASPLERVAMTDGHLLDIHVRVRRCSHHFHTQLVGTVAAMNRLLTVIENAVSVDRLAMPLNRIALYQRPVLHAVEIAGFIQVRTADLITSFRRSDRVIDNGRLCINNIVPFNTAAEILGLHRAQHRFYGQYQLVDTIFSCPCLILVVIMGRSRYTAQVIETAPAILLAFADGDPLYEMITCLVFGQDQTPYIVATRLLVRTLELIRARLVEDGVNLHAFTLEGPVISMFAAQTRVRLIDLHRQLDNMDGHDGVAAQIVREIAGFGIGLTVIADVHIAANDELFARLSHFPYRQVQAVPYIAAVRLFLFFLEVTRLERTDAMPFEG